MKSRDVGPLATAIGRSYSFCLGLIGWRPIETPLDVAYAAFVVLVAVFVGDRVATAFEVWRRSRPSA